MTTDTTPLIDGEPDFEITPPDLDLKDLAAMMPSNEEIEATIAEVTLSDVDLAEFAASLDALLSDDDRANVPMDKSRFDQIQWMISALGKGQRRRAKPVVPVTDTHKPALTPATPDFSTMPAHARMARGYTNR